MTAPERAATNDDLDDDALAGEVVVNGVDARSGGYAVAPLSANAVSSLAEHRPLDAAELEELEERRHRAKARLAPRRGIDANDLAQAGWGVVFAAGDPGVDAAREALAPLLTRRRDEAGARYREFSGDDGLRPDESGADFLARHGSAPGPVDPARGVPYYLVVVGAPDRVPFDAQTDMDVRHAVGRLELGSLDALAAYAAGVVRREDAAAAGKATLARRLAVFATRNAGDVATQRSARRLATPVGDAFSATHADWTVERHVGDAATKARLHGLLHDGGPPAVLFSATHGAVVPAGAPDQRDLQGALVTQEWPGPLVAGPLDAGACFAGVDVAPDAALDGMIAMLFACFGAGTPALDEFLPPEATDVQSLAPAPFVSRLSQALLARGAGAVIGHVERAWTCSFTWPGAGSVTTVFEDALAGLAAGDRVGSAVECLNERYAEISVELAAALEQRARRKQNQAQVAGLWLARTDARNYVVLGDPAVRLTFAPLHGSSPPLAASA